MGNRDEFLQFQRLLGLQKLMGELRYQGPKAEAEIGARGAQRRASQASAVHSLFPVMRESGISSLPEDLSDFDPIVGPSVSEAHGRTVGTYGRKGKMDESLIGRRESLNRSTDALTKYRGAQMEREPLVRGELMSRTRRNNASADMSTIYGDLRKRGYEDDQITNAMKAAAAQHGDRYQRALAARESDPNAPLPPPPSWEDIHRSAEEYLQTVNSSRSGPRNDPWNQTNYIAPGAREEMGTVAPYHDSPMGPFPPEDPNSLRAQFPPVDDQEEPSLQFDQFDEGDGPDFQQDYPSMTGASSYNGPGADQSFDQQQVLALLEQLRRQRSGGLVY